MFGCEFINNECNEPWPKFTLFFDLFDDEHFKCSYEGEDSLSHIRDSVLSNDDKHLWSQLLNKFMILSSIYP